MTALANEDDDKKTVARREQVKNEVDELKSQLSDLNMVWQAEREELQRTKTVQERLDTARRDLEKARQQGDFTTAGQLQHGTIPQLAQELQDIENAAEGGDKKKSHKMLAEFVSADAIASCVARHTGIPVSRITGSESKKLLDMESKLREVSFWIVRLWTTLNLPLYFSHRPSSSLAYIECCWTRSRS